MPDHNNLIFFLPESAELPSGNALEGDASSTSPVTHNDYTKTDDVTEDARQQLDLPEMATLEPVESLYRDDEQLSWDAILKKGRSLRVPKKNKAPKPVTSWDDDVMLGDDPRVHGADTTQDNDNNLYDPDVATIDAGNDDDDDDDLDKRGDDDRGRGGKHKGRGGRRKNGKKGRKNGRKNKNQPKTVLPSQLSDSATVTNDQDGPVGLEGNEETSNYIYEDTKAPPVKFTSCSELRCYAGGRCVPDEMRGGVRCQCMLGNTGEFCEQGKHLLYFVVIQSFGFSYEDLFLHAVQLLFPQFQWIIS